MPPQIKWNKHELHKARGRTTGQADPSTTGQSGLFVGMAAKNSRPTAQKYAALLSRQQQSGLLAQRLELDWSVGDATQPQVATLSPAIA
jgi:hypothetical protein